MLKNEERGSIISILFLFLLFLQAECATLYDLVYMMVGKLSFKNLPFVPEKGEVIYVESSYHRWLNGFIRNNYDWLKNTFSQHHLHFCYLPLRAKEVVNYYAPYLTTEKLQ